MIKYEYAGFVYLIEKVGRDRETDIYQATPVEGQHHAAWRFRNRQNAVQCWIDDGMPLWESDRNGR